MRTPPPSRIAEWSILGLVTFSILWKGGKGLEATWLLGLLAGALALVLWWDRLYGFPQWVQGVWVRPPMRTDVVRISPFLWWSAVLFVSWSILSYIFSHTQNYGLDELIRDTACILLFLWLADARGGGESFHRSLIATITWSTVAAVLVGIAVYINQPVDRFVGTFFDARFHTDYWPNAWADFLLLAWPCTLLATLRVYGWKRWGMTMILGCVLGSLLLSYSRGALLALGGQVVLLTLLVGLTDVLRTHFRGGKTYFTLQRIGWIAAGITLCAIAMLGTFTGINALRASTHSVQSVSEKIEFNAAEGRSSIDERAQFWQQAISLAAKRPLLGQGPYSFRFTQTPLMQGVLATSDHPHNVFLKLASERGVPAMIFFLVILATVIGATFLALYRGQKWDARSSPDSPPEWQHCILLISLGGVIAHSLIDYNLQFVGIALPFWLILGVLASPNIDELSPPLVRLPMARAVEVGLASILLIVLVLEGKSLFLSSFGRHAEARGDTEEALTWYNASDWALFSRDLHLSRAQLLLSSGEGQQALDALQEYQIRNPLDARAWKLRGEVHLAMNHPQAAATALERAYKLGRFTDIGMLRLWVIAVRQQKDTQAMQAWRDEWQRTFVQFAQATLQNTHFIALSANVEELQRASQQLAAAFPESALTIRRIASRAVRHAKQVRREFSARPLGRLW